MESTLLDRGLDIHDWWNRTRGEHGALKLSSRRLINVIMSSDEESPFKEAYREDWSDRKYGMFGILNELRIMRADNAAMHADHKMDPSLIKSPAQVRADQYDEEQRQAIRGGIMAQLRRPLPPKTE